MAERVKHTKGPLAAFKSMADFWNVVKGDGEFAPSVATVHPNYRVGVTAEECEANAHLFAAAPEMLEALREAKSELRDLGPDHPAMREIDTAIAKAEGSFQCVAPALKPSA